MTRTPATTSLPDVPAAGGPRHELLGTHLQRLVDARDRLENELRRCHDQLNRVFTMTGRVAQLNDPEKVQETLLRQYATVLHLGAVYVDRGGCCARVKLGRAGSLCPSCGELSTDQVRAVLARQIEAVRRVGRPLTIAAEPRLGDVRVLLGAMSGPDMEMGVIVGVRGCEQAAFDRSDVLTSESVLLYGAQLLSNAVMLQTMQQAALETVCALVNAIDAKDNYTSDHSERVGNLARMTGAALGLAREELQALEWAGLLHDVGKIGISEQILNKPGRLTGYEFAQMKRHPQIGYDTLRPVTRLAPVLDAVLYHHENFDGSGYPAGLTHDQTPLAARIIHVVDIFDALTTRRPYRRGFELEQAIALLQEDAGRVTDPEVTAAFIATLRSYIAEDPHGFRTYYAHLLENEAGD